MLAATAKHLVVLNNDGGRLLWIRSLQFMQRRPAEWLTRDVWFYTEQGPAIRIFTNFILYCYPLHTGLAGPTNQKNTLNQRLQSTAVLASAPAYNLSLGQRQLLKTVELPEGAAALSLVRPSLERLSLRRKALTRHLLISV